jgi:hypothetical protein
MQAPLEECKAFNDAQPNCGFKLVMFFLLRKNLASVKHFL